MNGPMPDGRLRHIADALDALPAPPWVWFNGNALTTDHSGKQALMAYSPYPGQFTFRNRKDRGALLNTAEELAALGLPNPVGDWIRQSGQFVTELLADNARLRGACNTTEFKCLTGEHCKGCEARDTADGQAEGHLEEVTAERDGHRDRAAELATMVERLHAQAHGSGTAAYTCVLEPCRGLYRHLPNPAVVSAE